MDRLTPLDVFADDEQALRMPIGRSPQRGGHATRALGGTVS
jgi:hypothetical protein